MTSLVDYNKNCLADAFPFFRVACSVSAREFVSRGIGLRSRARFVVKILVVLRVLTSSPAPWYLVYFGPHRELLDVHTFISACGGR